MTKDENGRIRLSWQQLAWAFSLLLGIGGAWVDLRVQMTKVEAKVDALAVKMDLTKQYADFQQTKVDHRLDILESKRH